MIAALLLDDDSYARVVPILSPADFFREQNAWCYEAAIDLAERGESVPVGAPLSRGTREQIYLCLRLGTLDYLDRGRESLPLLLDEALVHWDAKRRQQLLVCEAPCSRCRLGLRDA